MKPAKDFEYLEHTADLRFRAYGGSLDECFQNAAKAMVSSIVSLESIDEDIKRNIALKAETLDTLLHDFLSEILFLFETKGLLFKNMRVSITENREYTLKAQLTGEEYSKEKHAIKAEIKAVTYHEMRVGKENNAWIAEVLCDI
ncbi:MAG: archease [Candidatus Altiarchaeota archaeon]|nr:archease [Candidatus Altiarchaeota archaeon]